MLTILFALLMTAPLPDRPNLYVTDEAGVLDHARAMALNETLADFERKTSDQVLVYVMKRVPEGTTPEEMGVEAMRAWGVGQKGKDNGAILLLFTLDRKMRIEVGYGLEGSLTDAKAKQILSEVMKPKLRAGDFNGAVESGAEAILATIRGESYRGVGLTNADQNRRNVRRSEGGRVEVPFLNTIAYASIFLMLGGVLFLIHKNSRRPSTRDRWPANRGHAVPTTNFSSTDFSSSSSSSSDSSSSSSSGFESGGGSSGGGGASDSW